MGYSIEAIALMEISEERLAKTERNVTILPVYVKLFFCGPVHAWQLNKYELGKRCKRFRK